MKALLDDVSLSTVAVYQPRSAKQKAIWRTDVYHHRRISTVISEPKAYLPQVYSTTTIINQHLSTCGRHGRVAKSGTLTAINQAKPFMVQLYVNAVYQPRSSRQKHICLSCITTAMRNQSVRTSGRHIRVDQSDVSTATSEATALMAQLYISSAVYFT